MKIALDAMGGDHAPQVVIEGAIMAAQAWPEIEILLVGKQDVVESELKKHKTEGLKLSIVHASEVVEMNEHTMAVKEKKDASMNVAARLVRKGEADAFTTAGNTAAGMAAALFNIGRIKGIDRPALGTVYPAAPNTCFILDVGANTDLQPENLLQFAIMGNVYARDVLGISSPRLGIISNGEEEDKGSILTREAQKLLKAQPTLNYIGCVEGKDVTKGMADVVVSDGFVGNVMIKLTEGVVSFLVRQLKREFTGGWLNKIALILLIPGLILMLPGFLLLAPTVKRLYKRIDWREYGGAPMLGVNGVVVIGHGRSDAKAIKNMIRVAKESVEKGVVAKIRTGIEEAAITPAA
jgi:glycerol-3-phosphate acyltransferase PlsX